jgi:DNA mismatch repair protein MutL
MTGADAELAVERFATSKLESEADLAQVRTLGFRGEALPSIAAVAQFELLTRAAENVQGTRIRIVDDKKEIEVAGAPVGTLITARELFYNVPARKKFLKAPLRETELVTRTVAQYALAYPGIGFRLAVDGRDTLLAPPATALERTAAVWSREAANEMLPVAYDSFDLQVRGFISKPTFARASRAWQNFYVNGRPIRSGLLAVMLERPYAGRMVANEFAASNLGASALATNRHPLAVIHVELDPRYVDVNVHPRKAEVRFFQERSIYGAVQQAVEHTLRDFPVAQGTAGVEWPFANVPESNLGAVREAAGEFRVGTWRALGQIHNTYLLAQTPDGFAIVDQHAAQEQVLFERLTDDPSRGFGAGSERATQAPEQRTRETPSTVITLMPKEAARVNARLDAYQALGVEIESFGANTFRVSNLPPFVPLQAQEVLNTLVAEQDKYGDLESDALRDKLASKLACVSALKAGDALTLEQQQTLLDDLLQIYSPATCPHGRPTFVYVTLEELERRFLRR